MVDMAHDGDDRRTRDRLVAYLMFLAQRRLFGNLFL